MEYTIFSGTNTGAYFSFSTDNRTEAYKEFSKFLAMIDYFGGGYATLLDSIGNVLEYCS